MKKTFKTISSVNNIDFSGRLPEDAVITGKRASFRLIHNFGGDKDPLTLQFVMFAGRKADKLSEETLELLKKGKKIVVHAYMMSNQYTGEDGKLKTTNEYIVKSIEAADKETSVNNVDITGRLFAEPEITDKRCVLRIIHNISKVHVPIFKDIVLFDRTGKRNFGVPEELLKKGAPVLVHAFFNPNNMTDENGKITRYVVQLVGKSVEAAEMVDREYTLTEKEAEAAAEVATEEAIDLDIDVAAADGIEL